MNAEADGGLNLWRIPPDMFARAWPHCEDLMRRGLSAASEMLDPDTPERIAAGTLQVWVVTEHAPAQVMAVFLTDINEEAAGARWVNVHALVGRQMWRWANVVNDGMDKFARKERCKSIRFAGKVGWGRVLKDFRVIGEHSAGVPIFERAVS
jgi:hypothetical protein